MLYVYTSVPALGARLYIADSDVKQLTDNNVRAVVVTTRAKKITKKPQIRVSSH